MRRCGASPFYDGNYFADAFPLALRDTLRNGAREKRKRFIISLRAGRYGAVGDKIRRVVEGRGMISAISKTKRIVVVASFLLCPLWQTPALYAQTSPRGGENGPPISAEETAVIEQLCARLHCSKTKDGGSKAPRLTIRFGEGKDTDNDSDAAARDAARKLIVFGRRAVPFLAAMLRKENDKWVRLRAAWVLSQIRRPSAGRVLLPFLRDEKADPALRLLAAKGVAVSGAAEGVPLLVRLARSEKNEKLRTAAFMALRNMPEAWASQAALFEAALSDPREEIRIAAARVCFFTRRPQARHALIERVKNDPSLAVRINAVAALAVQKATEAVPVLVRVVAAEKEPAELVKQAVGALDRITGVRLRTRAEVVRWWKKYGKKSYPKSKRESGKATEKTGTEKDRQDGQKANAADKKAPPEKKRNGLSGGSTRNFGGG